MDVDVLIIGGGINGAAIAADVAGRKLRVAICEQNDFASATSSASSKLIHGGLRYLEQLDFKLVRESLQEREILLRRAPHLVKPLQFIIPDAPAIHRPWIIRAGLFLYDKLAHSYLLPKSKRINLADFSPEAQFKSSTKGFSYFDCWGDDARLVIANLQLAKQHGAYILPRTKFIDAQASKGHGWLAQLQTHDGNLIEVKAKILVNVAGPWADHIDRIIYKNPSMQHLHLVKGSHLVVKKFYSGDQAYLLQNEDGRVVFVIPYLQEYLIIGTTDMPYNEELEKITITSEETDYLLQVVNHYFKHSLRKDDIVWTYAGVRPLYKDKQHNLSKISRDYYIAENPANMAVPLISIYGGKLTTHRRLAENASDRIVGMVGGSTSAWTKSIILPGGDIQLPWHTFIENLHQQYPFLPLELVQHYAATYGSQIHILLKNIENLSDLGKHFGDALYEAEVRYLVEYEWAMSATDILWRRTKLGLKLNKDENTSLASWLKSVYSLSFN